MLTLWNTQEEKDDSINEIVSKDDYVHDSLFTLVKDKFGNYIVQKRLNTLIQNKKIKYTNNNFIWGIKKEN